MPAIRRQWWESTTSGTFAIPPATARRRRAAGTSSVATWALIRRRSTHKQGSWMVPKVSSAGSTRAKSPGLAILPTTAAAPTATAKRAWTPAASSLPELTARAPLRTASISRQRASTATTYGRRSPPRAPSRRRAGRINAPASPTPTACPETTLPAPRPPAPT